MTLASILCQAKGVSCSIYVGNPPNTGK